MLSHSTRWFSCWKLDLLKFWYFSKAIEINGGFTRKSRWYNMLELELTCHAAEMALSTVNSWEMDDMTHLKARYSPVHLFTSLNFVPSFLMTASKSIHLMLLLKSFVYPVQWWVVNPPSTRWNRCLLRATRVLCIVWSEVLRINRAYKCWMLWWQLACFPRIYSRISNFPLIIPYPSVISLSS